MKIYLSFIFLCSIITVNGIPRIVGGSDAPDGKYPYQVSIKKWLHICGGSILNKRWILTAAHCVERQRLYDLTIYVGSNKLSGGLGKVYHPEYIVHHSNFSHIKLENDIGLIRVKHDIEFNDKVQPVKLPSEDFTKTDYPAMLTGWGSIKLGGNTPNDLQEIELKVIDQAVCKSIWNDTFPITDSHICTLTKRGEGACHGDSGGPLVSDGIQIGIVSFGSPCAKGQPDVFTRVYNFLDWIKDEFSKF